MSEASELTQRLKDTLKEVEDCHKEIRALKRDLYGNPNVSEDGIFARLRNIEERLTSLRRTYEMELVEKVAFFNLKDELNQVKVDYKVTMVWVRGIAAGVGAIVVTLFGAAVVGILRFLGGA